MWGEEIRMFVLDTSHRQFSITPDWFQTDTTTVIHALLLYGITKWLHKYCSPILIVFENKIAQYTIYLLNCVLGYFYFFTIIIPFQKSCPFQFLGIFIFFSLSIFSFLHLKRAHNLEGNISVEI